MRIKLLIRNVNMGNSHDGLAAIAQKFQVNTRKLEGQDVVMFLNRASDKLKVLGTGNTVIGYLRLPKGRRIDLNAIKWLPQTFHASGKIDYDEALRLALTEALSVKAKRASPLAAYRAAKESGLVA